MIGNFKMKKNELFRLYRRMKDMNILLLFKGALSQEILLEIGDLITRQMERFPSEIQKSFSVFVELAQNIMKYSDEREIQGDDDVGVGIIVFTEDDDSYKIYSGNRIKEEDRKIIGKRLTEINNADDDELKAIYKEKRKLPLDDTERGPGLGLIEIARRSSGSIDSSINKTDNGKYFLEMIVTIKKENK